MKQSLGYIRIEICYAYIYICNIYIYIYIYICIHLYLSGGGSPVKVPPVATKQAGSANLCESRLGLSTWCLVLPLNRCVWKMPRHLLSSSIQRLASHRRTCPDLHTSGECSGVFLRVTSCITFSAFAGNFASLPLPLSLALSPSHTPRLVVKLTLRA